MSESAQSPRSTPSTANPRLSHRTLTLVAVFAAIGGGVATSRFLDSDAHASTTGRVQAVHGADEFAADGMGSTPAWQTEAESSAATEKPGPAGDDRPASDDARLGAQGALPEASKEWQTVGFLGTPEQAIRERLREGEVVSVEKGRGGRSLSFKITLADGTQGYFKPAQSFSAAHWYAEIAGYYLDRLLGLGRVPPTVSRRLAWSSLKKAAGRDRRIRELQFEDGKTLRGAFIHWLDADLTPIDPGMGWERWIRVEGALPRSPYQRPRHWAASRSIRKAADAGDLSKAAAEPTPRDPELAASISDMILFDYLTANVDRWGGRFTNVRTFNEGGPLMFFDNGAGFAPGHPHIPYIDAKLEALQRFRRSTVEAIRGLNLAEYERLIASDPEAPILGTKQLDGLRLRRELLLKHVDECVERFGEQAVYF